jgi:hypothetical protein
MFEFRVFDDFHLRLLGFKWSWFLIIVETWLSKFTKLLIESTKLSDTWSQNIRRHLYLIKKLF